MTSGHVHRLKSSLYYQNLYHKGLHTHHLRLVRMRPLIGWERVGGIGVGREGNLGVGQGYLYPLMVGLTHLMCNIGRLWRVYSTRVMINP